MAGDFSIWNQEIGEKKFVGDREKEVGVENFRGWERTLEIPDLGLVAIHYFPLGSFAAQDIN